MISEESKLERHSLEDEECQGIWSAAADRCVIDSQERSVQGSSGGFILSSVAAVLWDKNAHE